MKHAKFSPSKAHIWGNGCPGYISMRPKMRSAPKTDIAKEGTAAHWVLSQLLRWPNGPNTLDSFHKAPNGVLPTKEMVDCAKEFQELTSDIRNPLVEQCVNVFDIHSDCFGNLDFSGMTEDNACVVIDYKFGWIPVEVVGNLQLICYAWGILNTAWKANGPFDYFHLGIFQPRVKPGISWWVVSTEEVRQKIAQLSHVAHNLNGCTKPGLSRCRYCECKIMCPGFKKFGFSVEGIFSSTLQLEIPDINSLSQEYKILESFHRLFEERLNALKSEITARLKLGEPCEHYGIMPEVGRKYWTLPDQDVRFIGEMNKIDLSKTSIITPNQAKERGLPEKIVNQYSKRGTTVKLVPMAKLKKQAERIFKNGQK